jgi:ABC-type glycerol-3-phosphate transport system substrate-binding protein
MTRTKRIALAAVTACLACSSAASATETVTYTYDARGRVVKVVHTGTVNNNVQTCYKLDKADNRTNVKVTTSGTPPACP